VPGAWVWNGRTYAWRAGYWARVQPGYVWIPDHYRWTPSGYVYIPGYWDLAVSKRGLLYAPVYISPSVVVVGYNYTPAYAVRDTIVVDALFVRPTTCHYYFGDYYEVRYRDLGFESCVVYSQRNYDSIIVYERYERRSDPTWFTVQINVYNDRCAGRAERPPRTLNEQIIIQKTTVNNYYLIAPPAQVASAKSARLVVVDHETRRQAHAQALAVRQVAAERVRTEVAVRPGAPREARKASLPVVHTVPVKPGMVAPRPPVSHPAAATSSGPPAHTPTSAQSHPPSGAPPGHPSAPPPRPGSSPAPGTGAKPISAPGTVNQSGAKPPPGKPAPPPPPPGKKPPPNDKDKDKDKNQNH
jgi:hypothetical protein